MDKYAIVDVAGQQCKVMPDTVFRVPKLDAEVGSKVSIDKVLLVSDGKKIAVGQPYLEGKTIEGEVVRHGRDDKIIVFKKKRRKNYRRTRGHRQGFTELRVRALPT
jgi:large subunit ribosomal protein L21